MEFRVETDFENCEKLWQEFSASKNLFDLWEYRLPFYKAYKYNLHFIVGSISGKKIGVLPLWHEKDKGIYTFFGGTFPEPNSFFLKDKTKIGEFLNQAPANTLLYYLSESENIHFPFKESDPSYYLPISKYNFSLNAYLVSFKRKHRKNLKRDIQIFKKIGYSVRKNHLEDFNLMIKYNLERFKKESDFADERQAKSIEELIKVALKQKTLQMLSLVIDNTAQAVGISVSYNNCYHVLCGGRNPQVNNIGKLLILEQINDAIALQLDKLDFLTTDSGWKNLWNLEKDRLFEFYN